MNIVIATTGTGGDLFPGIAVGERLREKGCRPLFIVSGPGPEKEALRRAGFAYETVCAGRLVGRPLGERIRTIIGLPMGVLKSVWFLKRKGIGGVLGSGGYGSAPVVLAAWLLRIPRGIFEPNAVPGLANRLLARFANRVFSGFPGMERFFPPSRLVYTGTPVRKGLEGGLKKNGSLFSLLVLGGSYGAASINQAMVSVMPELIRHKMEFHVLHQTGHHDFEWVRQKYEEMGVMGNTVRVAPFLEEMGEAYAGCDLVLARSGGSTVAELVAVSRPAILIPYPHSVNHHQTENARRIAESGGAETISDERIRTEEGRRELAGKIIHLMRSPDELKRRARLMEILKSHGAAEAIAENLMGLTQHV